MSVNSNNPKQKSEYIGATTIGHLESVTIVFEADGSVSFGEGMKNGYVETAYERAKGPKVVNRINLPNERFESDVWHFFRKNFDKVFAVDTNSVKIEGWNIALTSVVELRQDFIGQSNGLQGYWRFVQPFCIETREPNESPEKLGWLLAFDQLKYQNRWSETERTGLIADHDLSRHAEYNSRSAPIVQRYALPPKVMLHYASSDTGRYHPLNKALAVADSISSQIADALKSGRLIMHHTTKPSNAMYESIRIIHAE